MCSYRCELWEKTMSNNATHITLYDTRCGTVVVDQW